MIPDTSYTVPSDWKPFNATYSTGDLTAGTDDMCWSCGAGGRRAVSTARGISRWETRAREERRRWEKAVRMHEAMVESREMGRDYSPRPEPRPADPRGPTSQGFHWRCHRKRAFKMRASRPGRDRGR